MDAQSVDTANKGWGLGQPRGNDGRRSLIDGSGDADEGERETVVAKDAKRDNVVDPDKAAYDVGRMAKDLGRRALVEAQCPPAALVATIVAHAHVQSHVLTLALQMPEAERQDLVARCGGAIVDAMVDLVKEQRHGWPNYDGALDAMSRTAAARAEARRRLARFTRPLVRRALTVRQPNELRLLTLEDAARELDEGVPCVPNQQAERSRALSSVVKPWLQHAAREARKANRAWVDEDEAVDSLVVFVCNGA